MLGLGWNKWDCLGRESFVLEYPFSTFMAGLSGAKIRKDWYPKEQNGYQEVEEDEIVRVKFHAYFANLILKDQAEITSIIPQSANFGR